MIHYITDIGVGNAWVANELREVQRAGIPFVLHAIRQPANTHHRSDWAQALQDGTHAIYPLPVFGSIASFLMAPFLFGRRFFAAAWNALTGEREHLRARLSGIAHFFVGCHWARQLRGQQVSHVHSQWAHSGATIGMVATWLLDKPFSFTGHACDLYRDRVALRDKIRRADFVVCISTHHRDFFLENGASPEQLTIVYCGIDPTVFCRRVEKVRGERPFEIRTACRLVEKKGLPYLIDACSKLKERGVKFHCTIGGSGPLEVELRELVAEQGLSEAIEITGQAIKQEDLADFMEQADVFCLPCIWSSDHDVDGLPQTLMEAMACEVPVVSTRLVGIPDLVIDEKTGLLVDPNSAEHLASALERLYSDDALRQRLAKAGQQFVVEKFDIRECLEPLLSRYRQACGMASARRDSSLLPA